MVIERILCPLASLTILSLPLAADALEQDYVAEITEVADETPDGWTHTVEIGAALQLGGSSQVPGQTDGPSVTLSLNFGYTGELWRGQNELRLSAGVTEALTKSPVVDDFVKATDSAVTEAIYYYHLAGTPWLGPFLRASARTSLFAGIDVRADERDYLRDGETITSDRLRVTDAFSPTYLKESAGLFARPLGEESLTIDFRLGVGARETFADGSYVITDDEATDEIEVTALQTYMQAGGEFATDLYGSADQGDISYGASFEMMLPFYDSINDSLKPIPATNYEIGGHFGARLTEWASITYDLGLLRIPQIIEEWQVTNSLLLSFNYGFTRGAGAE